MCAFNPAVITRVKLANHKEEVQLKRRLVELECVHADNMDQMHQDYVEVIQELRSQKYQEIKNAIRKQLGRQEQAAQKDMLQRQNEFFKVTPKNRRSRRRSRGLSKILCDTDTTRLGSSEDKNKLGRVDEDPHLISTPDVTSVAMNVESDKEKSVLPKVTGTSILGTPAKSSQLYDTGHSVTRSRVKHSSMPAIIPPLVAFNLNSTARNKPKKTKKVKFTFSIRRGSNQSESKDSTTEDKPLTSEQQVPQPQPMEEKPSLRKRQKTLEELFRAKAENDKALLHGRRVGVRAVDGKVQYFIVPQSEHDRKNKIQEENSKLSLLQIAHQAEVYHNVLRKSSLFLLPQINGDGRMVQDDQGPNKGKCLDNEDMLVLDFIKKQKEKARTRKVTFMN